MTPRRSPEERPPRIVAELGRPETPEETRARKERDSRLYRQRKTVNNLVLSLLVSLGVVLVMVLAVPRGDYDSMRTVDAADIAAKAQPSAGFSLAVPTVPDDWRATQAEIRSNTIEGVKFWYIGYLTPTDDFAAFKQAVSANETWLAEQLENKSATGVETRFGLDWTVYDHLGDSADNTNVRYALTTEIGEQTLIVYGTANPDDIWMLAEGITEQIVQSPSE